MRDLLLSFSFYFILFFQPFCLHSTEGSAETATLLKMWRKLILIFFPWQNLQCEWENLRKDFYSILLSSLSVCLSVSLSLLLLFSSLPLFLSRSFSHILWVFLLYALNLILIVIEVEEKQSDGFNLFQYANKISSSSSLICTERWMLCTHSRA